MHTSTVIWQLTNRTIRTRFHRFHNARTRKKKSWNQVSFPFQFDNERTNNKPNRQCKLAPKGTRERKTKTKVRKKGNNKDQNRN